MGHSGEFLVDGCKHDTVRQGQIIDETFLIDKRLRVTRKMPVALGPIWRVRCHAFLDEHRLDKSRFLFFFCLFSFISTNVPLLSEDDTEQRLTSEGLNPWKTDLNQGAYDALVVLLAEFSMLWDHWQEEVILTSARGPWLDPEGGGGFIYLRLLKEWVGDGEVVDDYTEKLCENRNTHELRLRLERDDGMRRSYAFDEGRKSRER